MCLIIFVMLTMVLMCCLSDQFNVYMHFLLFLPSNIGYYFWFLHQQIYLVSPSSVFIFLNLRGLQDVNNLPCLVYNIFLGKWIFFYQLLFIICSGKYFPRGKEITFSFLSLSLLINPQTSVLILFFYDFSYTKPKKEKLV